MRLEAPSVPLIRGTGEAGGRHPESRRSWGGERVPQRPVIEKARRERGQGGLSGVDRAGEASAQAPELPKPALVLGSRAHGAG